MSPKATRLPSETVKALMGAISVQYLYSLNSRSIRALPEVPYHGISTTNFFAETPLSILSHAT